MTCVRPVLAKAVRPPLVHNSLCETRLEEGTQAMRSVCSAKVELPFSKCYLEEKECCPVQPTQLAKTFSKVLSSIGQHHYIIISNQFSLIL